MHRIGRSSLLLTRRELVQLVGGTDKSSIANTVKVGLSRSRKSGNKSWKSVCLAGEIHIDYDTIPEETVRAHKLPSKQQLLDELQKQIDEDRKAERDMQACQLAARLQKSMEVDFTQYVRLYTGKVTKAQSFEKAKTQALLLALVRLHKKHSVSELLGACKKLQGAPKLPSSEKRLREKLTQAAKPDAFPGLLLHGLTGQKNAQKIGEVQRDFLIDSFASPICPTFKEVWGRYKNEAAERGWPELSLRNIGRFLSLPENAQQCVEARHGRQKARQAMEYTLKRKPAPYPDAVWSIDGTSAQIVYLPEGKSKMEGKLYIELLTDHFSTAILGYAWDWTETKEAVQSCLKMALRRGNRPEVVMYDQHSSNRSAEVQDLLDRMTRVHWKCQPYNGQSKKIEKVIGNLQNGFLRHLPCFKGSNITSPNKNLKANPEYLMDLEKRGQLPTLEGAMELVEMAIRHYNNSKGKDGKTRMERYLEPHPNRIRLEPEDLVSLTMTKRRDPAKYTQHGLILERTGTKYYYTVPDPDGLGDFEFRRQHLDEKFEVYADNEDPSLVFLYQNGKEVAVARLKEEFSESPIHAKEGEGAIRAAILRKRKAALDKLVEQRREIRENNAGRGIAAVGYMALHKDEMNEAEDMQMQTLLRLPAANPEPSLEDELIDFFHNQ